MKLFLKIIILSLSAMIFSCASYGNNIVKNEVVMTEGMTISVTNDVGTIIIQSEKDFKRFFTWADDTRSVTLLPRKERWNGSFGLYFPGAGNHWKEHDGITRAVVEEGLLYFNTLEELMAYLDRYENKGNLVYSDHGLCVYWEKRPGAEGTLVVQVWQLLVDGLKPTQILGSKDDQIQVNFK